jgi:hypothetical protein
MVCISLFCLKIVLADSYPFYFGYWLIQILVNNLKNLSLVSIFSLNVCTISLKFVWAEHDSFKHILCIAKVKTAIHPNTFCVLPKSKLEASPFCRNMHPTMVPSGRTI